MGNASILVIEDNLDNLELVRFLLDQAGYQVHAASDGRQGMDQARALHPDVILLDMSLPEIDGWTLARQLKDDPRTASIRIIALTAHALPGDRQKALDAGCDGYITKPLDVPGFVSTIDSFIGH